VQSIPSANLALDRTHRFLIDPRTHFDAIRGARAGRHAPIIGFYHSHPLSDPVPSATDLAGADADHLSLIVRPDARGCEARLFRLDDQRFVEVVLTVEE
jgi:proteasome lid subunit RPN8/RPN11